MLCEARSLDGDRIFGCDDPKIGKEQCVVEIKFEARATGQCECLGDSNCGWGHGVLALGCPDIPCHDEIVDCVEGGATSLIEHNSAVSCGESRAEPLKTGEQQQQQQAHLAYLHCSMN